MMMTIRKELTSLVLLNLNIKYFFRGDVKIHTGQSVEVNYFSGDCAFHSTKIAVLSVHTTPSAGSCLQLDFSMIFYG